MLIILPGEGQFADFEKRLDEQVYNDIQDGIYYRTVMLEMPRFRIESSFGLAEQLAAMGMPDASDPAKADLTGMAAVSPDENLYISAVLHKAYIDVTEEGTEAAAATGIVVGVTSAQPDEPPQMIVDRPFIYAIYDTGTREILFLGRVLDPS
jgi:serpin B